MYSVSRKNSENAIAPITTAVALAAESDRRRKIRIGRSGAGERSSIATNAAIRAAEAPRRETVAVLAQPSSAARVIA